MSRELPDPIIELADRAAAKIQAANREDVAKLSSEVLEEFNTLVAALRQEGSEPVANSITTRLQEVREVEGTVGQLYLMDFQDVAHDYKDAKNALGNAREALVWELRALVLRRPKASDTPDDDPNKETGREDVALVTPGSSGQASPARPQGDQQVSLSGQPDAAEPSLKNLPDDATLSPANLAKLFGVRQEPLRKRLERLRKEDRTCFVEIADRTSKEPQFLYSLGKVRPVIEDMKGKAASSGTSSKRPARKNSP